MTKEGFGMIYFHFYMETLRIKKNESSHDSVVVINSYKVVRPPPPKNKYELGGYVAASAIDE